MLQNEFVNGVFDNFLISLCEIFVDLCIEFSVEGKGGGYVRDQGSQGKRVSGYVRDQGCQGKGGWVCGRPGISEQGWWICERPGISEQEWRVCEGKGGG